MDRMKRFMNRRQILQLGVAGTLSWMASGSLFKTGQAAAAELPAQTLDPDAALQKLLDGNQRFMRHRPEYPDQTDQRLKEVAQAQHPFATVLSCADSRVPVELVFDQGVGDIFDIRIAGNIVIPEALGSIEYAVALLDTPLLMVLGHERCGAVTAAVKNEPLPGDISTFVKAILPAVERVKTQSGDLVDNAVVANVRYQIEQLQQSKLITERLENGTLKVVGGRYDLDTGLVAMIA